jgi:hypothetical protein
MKESRNEVSTLAQFASRKQRRRRPFQFFVEFAQQTRFSRFLGFTPTTEAGQLARSVARARRAQLQ